MSGGGARYELAEGKPPPDSLIADTRKERIESVLQNRTRNLVLVLDRLEDTFNMAAVLRTAEAFGLQEVHVVNNEKVSWRPNSKVTQGCDKWLDVVLHPTFRDCAVVLKARGFRLMASAVSAQSHSLFELKFEQKTALVFGNERFGISPDALTECDRSFWLPMLGFTQSLNISAAVSASVSQAVSWRLRNLGRTGDLTDGEMSQLRARFALLSVKQRHRLYLPTGK
jgi:tRNA (guanosine-2'-O-)-methyltransferase